MICCKQNSKSCYQAEHYNNKIMTVYAQIHARVNILLLAALTIFFAAVRE